MLKKINNKLRKLKKVTLKTEEEIQELRKEREKTQAAYKSYADSMSGMLWGDHKKTTETGNNARIY